MKGTRYIGIASDLRARIRAGEYPAGGALPSQKELAERFETTVMTVRQALSVLRAEGLVRVSHGVGTFVASGAETGRALRLRGFADSLRGPRARILTRITGREDAIRDARVLSVLGGRSRACCCLTRLRLVGGEPVILQRSYLPSRFSAVVQEITDGDSLYALLGGACGGVVEGREIVRAAPLGRAEAALLAQKTGTAALLSLRASFDLAGAVVLFDEAWIRTDRAFLSIRQTGGSNVSTYGIPGVRPRDPAALLLSATFWEDQ